MLDQLHSGSLCNRGVRACQEDRQGGELADRLRAALGAGSGGAGSLPASELWTGTQPGDRSGYMRPGAGSLGAGNMQEWACCPWDDGGGWAQRRGKEDVP